jgi:hypothetical protein
VQTALTGARRDDILCCAGQSSLCVLLVLVGQRDSAHCLREASHESVQQTLQYAGGQVRGTCQQKDVACLCSQRVDIGLWTDTVADIAKCLKQPDVDDPRSAAHLRCVQLVALLERVFILKVKCLLRAVREIPCAAGSTSRTAGHHSGIRSTAAGQTDHGLCGVIWGQCWRTQAPSFR